MPLERLPGLLCALGAGLLAVACAGSLPGDSQPTKERLAAQASVAQAGGLGADGTYVLSDTEKALDCKKLSGRMQLRILQIRDGAERETASGLSRGMQGATTSVLGGTLYGLDPGGQHAKDRAMLDAFNRQLAAKGCKTFDLAAELAPKPVTHTPSPQKK